MNDDYISASELNEYLYCRRAWWYRRSGVESAAVTRLDAGTDSHDDLAAAVSESAQTSRLGRRMIAVGVALLIALLLLHLLPG